MRTFIAGLLGGLVIFFWGFFSHSLLPIGDMGMKTANAEESILAAIGAGTSGEGVYVIPGLAPEKMDDAAAVKAYSGKALANPYAFVVFQPKGEDGMDMGDNLVQQAVSDTLAAMLAAFVLGLGSFGFAKRVFIATALGLFSWLSVSVPYWNWYRFPLDFTVGNLLSQVLGWMLAGIVMAWWLGRKAR